MEILLEDIAPLTGAWVWKDKRVEGIRVRRLLTDSRSLTDVENTMFVAIPTRTNDGARYMRTLYDRGVRIFLTRNVPLEMENAGDAVIFVHPDPVAALQKIASRRGETGGEVVAITGSKGKTTLKEWIFQLVEPLKETARSPRSYNSQIGVPLSMWEIGSETRLALIEAGISEEGEMSRLGACIKPDTVIITDMNSDHSDGFASIESKIREKVSLAATPGVRRIIYNIDDVRVREAVARLPRSVVRFSWSLSDGEASATKDSSADTEENPVVQIILTPRDGSRESATTGNPVRPNDHKRRLDYQMEGRSGSIEVEIQELHDLHNACGALAFMLAEGYEPELIAARFDDVHPITTRLSVTDGIAGCNVVYDSYTSDLSSLDPALDFLMRRKMPGQKSVVILSDMLHESGPERIASEKVAATLRRRGIDSVICVGPKLGEQRDLFDGNALFFPDTDSLLDWLGRNPLNNSIILLKGAPAFDFGRVRDTLEIRTHETLLEVNLDAMLRNYNYFRSCLPASTGMIAMVKASGYGVGSYEIAKTLQDAGAAYLAVAVLDEGIDLRRQGITMPIMVMNPRVVDYREMFRNDLEPEIYTRAMLEEVIDHARRNGVKDYPIHIKLDTGMHRMGFIENELPALMQRIGSQNYVRISTVFSHLATADMPDMNDYTLMQLRTFDRCSSYMIGESAYPIRRHILNSAGILRFPEYHYDFARLGIGLYGVNTLPPGIERQLDTVATLKTVIINIREWEAGTTVGYARRGLLQRASRVATIPIGYADGMSRHFGNGAVRVIVNGCEAPTLGNICMDACMIDVTGIDCKEGDSVEIFGENAPIGRLADALATIPYEILTGVSTRVKRVYYRE